MATPSQREGRDLLRLRRAVGRAEQALAELDRVLLGAEGICASDLAILERLARKGPQPINDLGRRVGLTSGSITTAVQRLRARNLVGTRRDPGDKRVVFATSTERGEALARRLSAQRVEALRLLFADWSSRERDLLPTLLKRVRKSVETNAALPAPTPSDD